MFSILIFLLYMETMLLYILQNMKWEEEDGFLV